ncbi:MAG TPA: enoyl-CoA hydratase-related protein [Acidimicrobiales bacterium]
MTRARTDLYRQIRYEVADPVATITLDRPDRLNGWTTRMGAEVRHAVAAAEADPAVVGIVITGAGRGFCAGADLGTLSSLSERGAAGASGASGDGAASVDPDDEVPADLVVDLRDRPDDLAGEYTYLLGCPKPIVAAINGPIAGMAVPIALACDLRFMAEDAPLVTAFAQRGLIAEWGLSWLLPRLVGPGVAMDLMLSSRKVSGAECARLGLVNAALPADEVLPHSVRYVQDLAAHCSPTSMAIIKRQAYAQLHAGLGPAERESQRLMVESFGRPDFAEGVQSFLERRPPSFPRIP